MNMHISPIPWIVRKTETTSTVIVHTPAASMPFAATACIITAGAVSYRPAISLIMLKRPTTVPLTILSVYGKKTVDHG
jgi:hypothetical protein